MNISGTRMPALPSLLFLAVREPLPARVLICFNLRILLPIFD